MYQFHALIKALSSPVSLTLGLLSQPWKLDSYIHPPIQQVLIVNNTHLRLMAYEDALLSQIIGFLVKEMHLLQHSTS